MVLVTVFYVTKKRIPKMATYAFSDDLPLEAVKTLYQFALGGGQTGNKRDALRAALVVVDYAAQFVVGPAANVALPPDEVYKALAEHLAPLAKSDAEARRNLAVNWQAILALALQLLPLILPLLKQGA